MPEMQVQARMANRHRLTQGPTIYSVSHGGSKSCLAVLHVLCGFMVLCLLRTSQSSCAKADLITFNSTMWLNWSARLWAMRTKHKLSGHSWDTSMQARHVRWTPLLCGGRVFLTFFVHVSSTRAVLLRSCAFLFAFLWLAFPFPFTKHSHWHVTRPFTIGVDIRYLVFEHTTCNDPRSALEKGSQWQETLHFYGHMSKAQVLPDTWLMYVVHRCTQMFQPPGPSTPGCFT